MAHYHVSGYELLINLALLAFYNGLQRYSTELRKKWVVKFRPHERRVRFLSRERLRVNPFLRPLGSRDNLIALTYTGGNS